MSAQARTMKHVPMAARSSWSRILLRTLALVASQNTEAAWIDLMMLPKTVLLTPKRGGKKHRSAAATFVRDRICRWEAGERLSLWQDVVSKEQRSVQANTVESRRRYAVALCREGFDRKACSALVNNDMLPYSLETYNALKTLHPEVAPPSCPDPAGLPQAANFDVEELMVVLQMNILKKIHY